MKTLMILRHAKPVDPGLLDDFKRPLTDRGIAQAEALGLALREQNYSPEKIFSSPAVRTLETTLGVLRGGGFDCPLDTHEDIYNGSGHDLLRVISNTPESIRHLLLVGHLPGVGELTRMLALRTKSSGVDFHPCTLAVMECMAETWNEIPHTGGVLKLSLPPLA